MKRKKGDIPVGKDVWDSQYMSGYWKYMQDLDELPRYSIIAGYFQSLKLRGSILDVGCGEGILEQRLGSFNYSKYVGIDISEAAITQAAAKKSEKALFICHNALDYVPTELFDAIVFNETLYYFEYPLEVVRKYTKYLNEDGIFLTGMYLNSERATSIWRKLKSVYISLDEVKVTNKSNSWIFNVFINAKLQR
jgi:2-polyprenyl-3-methyl-5-hydroxy-6-metoxy-1,4-benzoquinol methylase